YPGRTRHIHVKAQAPTQPVLTTQLYFPGEAANARDGIFNPDLVMKVEERDGGKLARFDFVLAARRSAYPRSPPPTYRHPRRLARHVRGMVLARAVGGRIRHAEEEMPEETLRAIIVERLANGLLPWVECLMTWWGPGKGNSVCAACGRPIVATDIE